MNPQTQTMKALSDKDDGLDDVAMALKQKLTGNSSKDAPITAKLADIRTEQALILSRLGAIGAGGAFTGPTAQQLNDLQTAINTVDADVHAGALLNTLMTDATNLLNQYGGNDSKAAQGVSGAAVS